MRALEMWQIENEQGVLLWSVVSTGKTSCMEAWSSERSRLGEMTKERQRKDKRKEKRKKVRPANVDKGKETRTKIFHTRPSTTMRVADSMLHEMFETCSRQREVLEKMSARSTQLQYAGGLTINQK